MWSMMANVFPEACEKDVIVLPEKSNGDGKNAKAVDDGAMLRCLLPLTLSMRIFGLFFLRGNANIKNRWSYTKFSSLSHAYSFAVLLALWLNTIRLTTIFYPQEKGENLVWKSVMFIWNVMLALAQTACYRACSTGKILTLFLIFSKMFTPEGLKYVRKKALLCAIWAWTFFSINIASIAYFHFSSEETVMDISLAPFRTFAGSDPTILTVLRCLNLFIYLYANAAAQFPMALSLVIAAIFSHQFTLCNRKFRRSIEKSASVKETFEELRQRHQMLSRLVSKADKFICFSNAAYVGGLIYLVIAYLYNLIWNPVLTSSPIIFFLSIVWMTVGVCGLLLVSFGSVIVNQAVSVHRLCESFLQCDSIDIDVCTILRVFQMEYSIHDTCTCATTFHIRPIVSFKSNKLFTSTNAIA